MTRYKSLTIEKPISFGGEGSINFFSEDLGHEIESDWVVVVVRKGDDESHFPWCRVTDAKPVKDPVKGERIEQAWKDYARSPLMPSVDQAFADMKPEERHRREAAALKATLDDTRKFEGVERRSGKGPAK